MRYATYLLEMQDGIFNPADAFTLVSPSARGIVIHQETGHHRNRLGALRRVQRYNAAPVLRSGRPLFWMIAVELKQQHEGWVDIWIEGEQGSMDINVPVYFRFLVPTAEEAEILAKPFSIDPPKPPGVACHVQAIRQWIPTGDEALRKYLRESVACYRRKLWRPAAVMLGCVAERLANDLIAAYDQVLDLETQARFRKRLSKRQTAAKRFEVFCKHFDPARQGTPPEDHLALCDSYRVVRQTRNRACHTETPGVGPIDRDVLADCFRETARFCQESHRVLDHFERRKENRLAN